MFTAPAAIAAPIAPRTDIIVPFPAWVPTQLDHELADRFAWGNDSAENDPLDGYPGPGWQDEETGEWESAPADADDAGPPYDPTDAEQASYLAGEAIPATEWDARDALWAQWTDEARQQAELDDLFRELHSPYTPTYLGDPQVARLALASSVGHPA